MRDGRPAEISSYDLLVGDVLIIDTGDILAADGILFAATDMRQAPHAQLKATGQLTSAFTACTTLTTSGTHQSMSGADWHQIAHRVDESHLTGEADDVFKDAQADAAAMSGSKVLQGSGRMLVTAVGLYSQQGLILGSLAGAGDDGRMKYAPPAASCQPPCQRRTTWAVSMRASCI